jgi:hypothetical protein
LSSSNEQDHLVGVLMTLFLRLTIAVCLIAAGVGTVAGAGPQHPVKVSRHQLALCGYDAVAYSTTGQPTQGTTNFEHRWNGAVWRFSTAANRDQIAKGRQNWPGVLAK